MIESFALYTDRADFSKSELCHLPTPRPASGEALLQVEGLAMTANTMTYAVTGEALGYWKFFPAQDPFGLIPTWGLARVVQSRCDNLREGHRWFGLLPLTTSLVVRPEKRGEGAFIDAAPHRQALPTNYNLYKRTDMDPFFFKGREEECALLRPVVLLSHLLVEDLATRSVGADDEVLVTSASSKAALAAAYLARKAGIGRWRGLTSSSNAAFVKSIGVYDEVQVYDEIEASHGSPKVLLDISGNTVTRKRIDARWGPIAYSCIVGATHWDAAQEAFSQRSSASVFFAPDVMKAAISAEGRAAFEAKFLKAWRSVLDWTPQWLSLDRRFGASGLLAAYRDLLHGKTSPDQGIFVGLEVARSDD